MISVYLRAVVVSVLLASALLGGCSTKPIVSSSDSTNVQSLVSNPDSSDSQDTAARTEEPDNLFEMPQALSITGKRQTGQLLDEQLNEISGLAASHQYPGTLFAINDSGNSPILFAIDETGRLIEQWNINAPNRDWEELTYVTLGGFRYLVIADTGDNLRIRNSSVLHLLREPTLPATRDSLDPEHSIRYRYEDGPRNVEAISFIGTTLYLLSKEPVDGAEFLPHQVYTLELPQDPSDLKSSTVLNARFVGTMPSRASGFEASLAAALAGVDLSHPTAMEFDDNGNTAYVLTYREVLRVRRQSGQSWPEAFSNKAERIMRHNLNQAEALAISPGRAIWFTSEKTGAPLWAIPLVPPL